MPARSHDGHRPSNRCIPTQYIRPRRPRDPPSLLRKPIRSRPITRSKLAAGTTDLCDRYAFSGVAFSAAKCPPFAWSRAPDVGLPAPDLTHFLDLAPEVAAAQGDYGEERYETEVLQVRVRTVFKDLGVRRGVES